MNEASEKKKKNAMKIIGIGFVVSVIGLIVAFVYDNLLDDPNSLTFDSVRQVGEVLCCGGPITVLVGVAMLVAFGLDDQYVSILPVQEPPDGPH